MTDANSITNFNFGFSTHKSDILIHLSQWQYWWWFWFSLFWVLYFFIILRVVHRRTQQFNPILNTSIRGHGKWGDFLVALIPLSWCGNILVNSNFILRMIEWQNEGSLFTLRVIGRQWYWEYRYDSSAVASILSAPKNIGHNRWFFMYANESYCSDSYYQALTLGMQLEYKNKFYSDLIELYNFNLKKVISGDKSGTSVVSSVKSGELLSNINYVYKKLWDFSNKYENAFDIDTAGIHHVWTDCSFFKKNVNSFYNLNFIDERSNYASNVAMTTRAKPMSVLAGVLNKHNISILKNVDNPDTFEKPIMFVLKIWGKPGVIEQKTETSHLFWGFRQKRYVRKKNFVFKPKLVISPDFVKSDDANLHDEVIKSPLVMKSSLTRNSHAFNDENNFFVNNNYLADSKLTPTNPILESMTFKPLISQTWDYQTSVKFNRHRAEIIPVNLAKRLLRTKRILVLPAHVNITVVTNSGDVVHSWFIPGLGIKLDCVPGRSTHHTFYIDNVGFYYGQCAEICGRYHHHMPIRLCALPFEQFLVWWQRKGLRRFSRLSRSSSGQYQNNDEVKFRYKW